MSPVLEVVTRRKSLTSTNNYNDWLAFLDEKSPTTVKKWFLFPNLSTYLVEHQDGNWTLVNGGTTASQGTGIQMVSDIVDDTDSPIIPPKRKFRMSVRVKSIRKGRPAICDEIEYE